ncbi:hypothetical protein ACHAO8_006411 [Botrytis cinerea]
MPEKESKALPKMNISSAWALLQKVSALVNNLLKSQEEARLSRNKDSETIEKLRNKVKTLENELKGVNQDFERRIRQLETTIYRSTKTSEHGKLVCFGGRFGDFGNIVDFATT